MDKFKVEDETTYEKFQIVKYKHESLDVISVYRSHGINSVQLLDELTKLIDQRRTTLIVGDFNLCYYENQRNRLVQGLIGLGFNQLVHQPTHIRGRIIDHAYFKDLTNQIQLTIERHTPYYTDHDALCICIDNYGAKKPDEEGPSSH